MTTRLMRMAWPAFLAAGLLEILVFAFVDPQDLNWQGAPLELSRGATYTAAFFAFWAISMVCSAMTYMLSMSSEEINHLEDASQSKAPS